MSGFGAFLGGLSGGTIGASVVQLLLDSKRFDSGLAQSQGKLTASNAKMSGSVGKFSSTAVLGYAAIAAGVVALGAKAVSAASDQEEALNKVNVIFGSTSQAIEAFADTAAESFGISKTAALSAAGTFGGLFQTVGLGADQIDDMSIKMVELAADLASFNNVDPTEALDKLRSGLSGEAEPLRQLNIFLNEGRVKAEAYASGIAEAGEELTDAQKVQARYNIILQDSQKAQGDFSRTSGSMANQQRILSAQVADLAAEIGKSLLPVVKLLLEALNALLTPIREIIETLTTSTWQRFQEDLLEVGASTTVAADSMERMKTAVEETSASLHGMGGIMQAEVRRQERAAEVANGLAQQQAFYAYQLRESGAAARDAGRGFHRFARLSEQALEEFKENTKEAFGGALDDVQGFKRGFEGTARSFRRQVDQMREKAEAIGDDLHRFRELKGVPEEFQAWLLTQGPDAIHNFVQNSAQGRTDIINDWKAIDRQIGSNEAVIDKVTRKLENVKTAVGELDGKKATIDLELRWHQTGEMPPADVANALAYELVRGQT